MTLLHDILSGSAGMKSCLINGRRASRLQQAKLKSRAAGKKSFRFNFFNILLYAFYFSLMPFPETLFHILILPSEDMAGNQSQSRKIKPIPIRLTMLS